MQLKLAAIATILAVAGAQDIASEVAMIPSCAATCLTDAIASAGCELTDYACQCGDNKSKITTSATPCVIKGCSGSDALKTQSVTTEICKLSDAGASSGSSSSAESAPASSAAESSPAASSMAEASSTMAEASSTMAEASSTMAAASSTMPAGSSGATDASSTPTPTTVTTNSGNKMQVGGVMVLAAGLVAFAL